MASAIHYKSGRNKAPFIEINCAALPEQIIESELFGHEKGAFTDAKTNKKGLFELGDKGTVFLDEIGDMPLPAQAKLLRFLEKSSSAGWGPAATSRWMSGSLPPPTRI